MMLFAKPDTRQKPSGFTLVELLVVITIIGILIALLLPAVQGAREAARAAQCMNNIRQMAIASLHHVEAQGHFPTGGWGWRWAGDPDRGFNHRQPSGWHYNILPYLELQTLWELGGGLTDSNAKAQAVARRLQTPVSVFNCPSRRRSIAYPYPHSSPYLNATKPPAIGRSDYAACGGDMANPTGSVAGPGSLSEGDGMTEDQWNGWPGTHNDATGVIYRRSQIQVAHIRDGTSNTYLLGERYLNPDNYFHGVACADDQGWDQGYDYDTNRWTYPGEAFRPRRDTPGYNSNNGCDVNFGSAHPSGFHMALCDGSVHRISYSIDLEVHRRLGNRSDGLPIPGDAMR